MKTILVVDDETIVLDALRRILRRRYEVIVATSSAEALALLDRTRPAAAIVDYRLGRGVDGVTLLREIRARLPSCRRILTGGYIEREVEATALSARDAHAVIEKPWGRNEVETLVACLLAVRSPSRPPV